MIEKCITGHLSIFVEDVHLLLGIAFGADGDIYASFWGTALEQVFMGRDTLAHSVNQNVFGIYPMAHGTHHLMT